MLRPVLAGAKLAVAGRLGPSAQSPYDGDANAEGVVAGALDSAGSGVRLQGRPEHGVPVDRPGHARRRSVRGRPAHGEDSCGRAGSPLGLSEASPLTRGDVGAVSPWRARGGRMSDYRVTQDFAFEGNAYHVGDVLRLSDPLQARGIKEWPWPSSFLSAGAGTTGPRAPVRRRLKRDVSPRRREPARPCLSARGDRPQRSVVPSLPGREDRALPPPWKHDGTRLRQRAPGAAEAARSPRRQRADAVRPLRRGSSSPARRSTSATPTETGRATTVSSTRPATEAQREAGVRRSWDDADANTDAPAPLSSLLLLGLRDYRRNDLCATTG